MTKKKENPLWLNDNIQFARFIAEAEAAGAFSAEVITDMTESMDLEAFDVEDLIERAQDAWEKAKEKNCPIGNKDLDMLTRT